MKNEGRALVLAASAVIGSFAGAIYMWSIFNVPLMESYNWDVRQISLAYSLYLFTGCCSGFLAGWLQRRMKSNLLMLIAGFLFSGGWFLTGFATSIPLLYLTFSFIAGFGDGIVYNTAVATATKWFPDKRGFANGVCVGCMGISALIFAPLGNVFITAFGPSRAFNLCGIVFLAFFLTFSWFIKAPEPGWVPEGWHPDDAKAGAAPAAEREYMTPAMLRTPVYWVLWIMFVLATSSGMMMTGHASNIGQDLAGMTASQGALMVGILSIGNFCGRFGFGWLSDKIGRYNTLVIMLAITGCDMMLLFGHATTFPTFMVALVVVGACFGGIMSVVPSLCGDLFGNANFGMNYAALYTGYTVAAFVGPMLAAGIFAQTGAYVLAFVVAGALALGAIVLVFADRALAKRMM
ncbi:MAG: OFA family MFS transporter [Eggerthellaceae bacterium]|nr:OFA family MFS transporter [Eggerthellaceae bacterium]